MSMTVCLAAKSISYPEGGGLLWMYLNWALGLRAVGCNVVWLEAISPRTPADTTRHQVAALRHRLAPYGLDDALALTAWGGEPLGPKALAGCLDLNAATEADLLLNTHYFLPATVVGRFRRSALLDLDPGLLQVWMANGDVEVAPHDRYFTMGETVGQPDARFPDLGLDWVYTPPCLALDWWTSTLAEGGAPFTTVTHWYAGGAEEADDKRQGFQPYLTLPDMTPLPLELALDLAPDDPECDVLRRHGWRIRSSHDVASTPWQYQRYIASSFGEFSCAKPSYVRLQTAWVSERTLCYLASGKPAVVEYTGPSRILPDRQGVLRFRDPAEAASCLQVVGEEYERQCRLARQLAEQYFDACVVLPPLLDRAVA